MLAEDFVVYSEYDTDKKRDVIKGGGYMVGSILLNNPDIPLMGTIGVGGKDNFKNLAVPLCMFQDRFNVCPKQNECTEVPHNRTVIGDDIYDNLLELVTPKRKERVKTKKGSIKIHRKKTRKSTKS